MEHLQDMALRAKKAARQLALYDTGTKRRALQFCRPTAGMWSWPVKTGSGKP